MILSLRTRYSLYLLAAAASIGLFFAFFSPFTGNALTPAQRAAIHEAPRTANYYLYSPIEMSQADEMAKYDLIIVSPQTKDNSQQALRQIKRLNPDILIFVYVLSQEFPTTYYKQWERDPNGILHRLFNGIEQDMWLYQPNGEHAWFWDRNWMLNPDSRWAEYVTDYVKEEFFSDPNTVYDGVFFDNIWVDPLWIQNMQFDFNRDGVADTDSQIVTAWQRGTKRILQLARQKLGPEPLIIGNGRGGYNGELNGMYLENFREGGSRQWAYWMNILKTVNDSYRAPQVPIVGNNTLNTGDFTNYRNVRFGLGSALLEDGYHGFDLGDRGHESILWFDEYDVGLGDPVGDPVSVNNFSSYQPDVWRRDFTHGLVVVNSTDRPQRISLGGEFEKLNGTQDPRINDGSIVSEVSLDGLDALLLLKTFEGIENTLFTNGHFARFFGPTGHRLRNGFFVFDARYRGGAQVASIDLDNNGKNDLIVATGNKLEAWRDDGLPFMKRYPYTANYKGELRIATGDLNEDGLYEVYVAPSAGHALPIKVFTRHGRQMKNDWYPFGTDYTGGYTLDVRESVGRRNNELIIGTGANSDPIVHIYDRNYDFVTAFYPFETTAVRGGVSVAAGDFDGDGIEEIVTGAGPGSKPRVRIFDGRGEQLYSEFMAFSAIGAPGVEVRAVDVDFDGKDDIVTLSDGF